MDNKDKLVSWVVLAVVVFALITFYMYLEMGKKLIEISNRIDVLSEKINTLNTQLETHGVEIKNLKGEMAENNEYTDDRIGRVEGLVIDMARNMNNLNSTIVIREKGLRGTGTPAFAFDEDTKTLKNLSEANDTWQEHCIIVKGREQCFTFE